MNRTEIVFVIAPVVIIMALVLTQYTHQRHEVSPVSAEWPITIASSTPSDIKSNYQEEGPVLLPVISSGNDLRGKDEKELLKLTNQDRVKNHLAPLRYSPILSRAAQDAVTDESDQKYFGHYTPNGHAFQYWLNLEEYKYQYAGENLARGYATIQDAETAFMASPTHRANILSPDYTEIGIDTLIAVNGENQSEYIVVMFASPRNNQ